MLVSGSFFVYASSSFSDLSTTYDNYDAIEYVKANEIVSGYPDGTFQPDNTINRAEFTKIIINATYDEEAIENCLSENLQSDWTYVFFPDVSRDEWYAKYICVAKMNNIVGGYQDGTFQPEQEISFVEAAKVIVNAFDYNTVSDTVWYKPFVEVLGEESVIPITISAFDESITRGEMAEMIYRIKADIKDKPYMIYHSDGLALQCTKSDFKMAFVLVVEDESDATESRLDTLYAIKDSFDDAFYEATDHLATMDTSDDVFILKKTDAMDDDLNPESINPTEILKEFYSLYEDEYDFLSIYTTFENSSMSQGHGSDSNNIQGIGKSISSYSSVEGVNRYMGRNFMKHIDMYQNSEEGLILAVNGLLHETGHQWGAYAGENFTGNSSTELGILWGDIHFYRGLESPYETGTPMNSDYWLPDGDGTYYVANVYTSTKKYHPFLLYFMGLLPESEYDTKYKIYDAGGADTSRDYTPESATLYGEVSVRDIIEFEGERECVPY
ncbi:S-layer homology domain-containing protein [Patescibacteria group bacterium]|nr:S-layer homology domain-containing protein [Patescibacteria group bacterium]